MPTVEEARAALEAAGERQKRIDELVAEKQARLDKLAADRANKGRGRPNAAHSARKKALESAIARLQQGFLPEESGFHSAPRTADELRASAARHPQHHAAASTAPPGRPRSSGGDGGGNGGGGGDGGGVSDGGGEADDDDIEDANFHHFYRVSTNQKAFNATVASEYLSGVRDRKVVKVEPDDLITSGCKPELIGLGAVHVCAPHLHLGLPMMPCPRHGWESVDDGHVSSKGMCPARRVFAETTDEWLLGTLHTCALCRAEKSDREAELAELEEDGEEGAELNEARAAVVEATYSYRCVRLCLTCLCTRHPLPPHMSRTMTLILVSLSGRTIRSRSSCTRRGILGIWLG